jgi:hypothetical protein
MQQECGASLFLFGVMFEQEVTFFLFGVMFEQETHGGALTFERIIRSTW